MRTYYDGLREGLTRYAHWSSGVQFVGTTGTTLKEALKEVDAEEALEAAQVRVMLPPMLLPEDDS